MTWNATGVLTTASDLLFSGVYSPITSRSRPWVEPDPVRLVDGYFYALDARTGELLWKKSLGSDIRGGPVSYSVRGTQYITIAAGHSVFAFALRQ